VRTQDFPRGNPPPASSRPNSTRTLNGDTSQRKQLPQHVLARRLAHASPALPGFRIVRHESDDEVPTPFDGDVVEGPVVVGVDALTDSSSQQQRHYEPIAKPWTPPVPALVFVLRLPLGRTGVDAMGARARLSLSFEVEGAEGADTGARGDVHGKLRLPARAIGEENLGDGGGNGGVWGHHEVAGGYVGEVDAVESRPPSSPAEVVMCICSTVSIPLPRTGFATLVVDRRDG